MFGESESESPRVPSPWDPFLPSPTQSSPRKGIPSLVPEAEEGNVEYKLKLTHISPARFARLVTQLKWRLLEGGGQAYYELGVADSGALIGLSRTDLEHSLETLEMMAGEIGASVIVVKEIEVPPIMFELAGEASKYLDPHTGAWTKKMTSKRRIAVSISGEDDSTTTTTETETDLTDFDDTSSSVSYTNTPEDPVLAEAFSHRLLQSHPNRPTTQSSPYISPLDDDLALFSMEPEPPHRIDEVEEIVLDTGTSPFLVDLEIASVYKPRPTRRRVYSSAGTTSTAPLAHDKHHKSTEKAKKPQPWHTATTGHGDEVPNRQETKAAQRRLARDRRREEKARMLLALGDGACPDELAVAIDNSIDVEPAAPPEAAISHRTTVDDMPQTEALVSGLDALHVTVEVSTSPDAVQVDPELPPPLTGQGQGSAMGEQREPRLIVEALVVRKMSIEEAFLDFGGFSLV
ncbi:hypothetical protein B0H21DRAFT_727242 [Amylocystis lapponica]|nr:hypothetical protein B0H21DRAFT_727242 [Amylocystis lapponica]